MRSTDMPHGQVGEAVNGGRYLMADDTYSRGPRKDPYGRGGTGAPGQATDPLTELARLIGQSDPFAPEAGHDRRPAGSAADPRAPQSDWRNDPLPGEPSYDHRAPRSEEHTSELQSLAYLVCRLLLEKKKKKNNKKLKIKKIKKQTKTNSKNNTN